MRIADRPNVFDYRWGVDNDNWKDEGTGGSYPRLHIKVKPNTYYTISWDIGKYLQDPVTSNLYMAVNNNDEPSYQGRNWLFHQTSISLQKASTTKKSSPTGFLYLECKMTNYADRPKVFNENIKWCIMEGTLENTFIPYTDGFDRRKVIDSGELVSYCERYGMEVQDEIKVNQMFDYSGLEDKHFTNFDVLISGKKIVINGTSNVTTNIQYAPTQVEDSHYYLLTSYITKYTEGTKFPNMSFYGANVISVATDSRNKASIRKANANGSGYFRVQVLNGENYDIEIIPIIRDLTSLGLADKSLEWLQTNRPDLFQNTEYIPETKTIKSVIRRIK